MSTGCVGESSFESGLSSESSIVALGSKASRPMSEDGLVFTSARRKGELSLKPIIPLEGEEGR